MLKMIEVSSTLVNPYYDQMFFNVIRDVKQDGSLRISTMTTSMWYRVILESTVTHAVGLSGTRELRPCKVEEKHPENDWERIWTYLIIPGLPSDLTSFLWLMLHNLLPTKERLFRLNMPNINENTCDLCNTEAIDNLQHALLKCPSNNATNSFLLESIRGVLPDVQTEQVVLLDLHLQPDQELPVIYLIACVLSQIWDCRKNKKQSNLTNIRANLEASIQILRKSRHYLAAIKLDEMLNI